MKTIVLALLLGAALLLPGCAGDRHLGPRVSQSFDKVFAGQAREREPIEGEMGTEEAEQVMANLKQMSLRPATTQTGGMMPVVPMSR